MKLIWVKKLRINILPIEIINYISTFLKEKDWNNFSKTNKLFKRAAYLYTIKYKSFIIPNYRWAKESTELYYFKYTQFKGNRNDYYIFPISIKYQESYLKFIVSSNKWKYRYFKDSIYAINLDINIFYMLLNNPNMNLRIFKLIFRKYRYKSHLYDLYYYIKYSDIPSKLRCRYLRVINQSQLDRDLRNK